MDVLDKDEFLKAYRSISAQLKRKFVRKPNITDAVESFENLSRHQLDLGFTELSAVCRLAAAQLEQLISLNSISSISTKPANEYNNLFLESARTFSQSVEQTTTCTCYEAAINSTSDICLAWLTSMEAGQTALSLNDYSNATHFFSKAFSFADNDKEKNLAGNKLASSLIQQGLFSESLKILVNIKANQDISIILYLLALNLKRCGLGESKISQLLQMIFDKSEGVILPQPLQSAFNELMLNDFDEVSISNIWSYLNNDQQHLLLCFLHHM